MAKFARADRRAEKRVFSALPASMAMFARMAKFHLPKARPEALAAALGPPPPGIPEALFERRLRRVLKPLDGI